MTTNESIKSMIFSSDIEMIALGITIAKDLNAEDLSKILDIPVSDYILWRSSGLGSEVSGEGLICMNKNKSWMLLRHSTHISLSKDMTVPEKWIWDKTITFEK